MTSTTTITMVGGGTLAAVHLLRRAHRPVRLVVVDRQPPIGHGVAFGTADPLHLLNVRAGNMSALPEVPAHFAPIPPARN